MSFEVSHMFEKNTLQSTEEAYVLGLLSGSNKFTSYQEFISFKGRFQIQHSNMGICQHKYENICKILSIQINESEAGKVANYGFPQSSEENQWAFIRGHFESTGSVVNMPPSCFCFSNDNILEAIAKLSGIPCSIDISCLTFKGVNAIDFLGKLYHNSYELKNEDFYKNYLKLVNYKKLGNVILKTDHQESNALISQELKGNLIYDEAHLSNCKVYKSNPDAILPSKSRVSDVGYDLTVIKKHKQLNDLVCLYDTGIKIQMEHGLFAQVFPRSSLSKSGYILANSVGIIDPSYNGNLYIALMKVDPNSPEITLPFRCCQLVFSQQKQVVIEESVQDFEETHRNQGGFGSTGN